MALLAPDPRRIGRPDTPPAPDRAPDAVAAGTPEPLRSRLIERLGADRVLARPIDLVRYASDASPYRRLPKVVVMARDERDVAGALEVARELELPLTFRGAGTSLNGQGQTDGILVDVPPHWSAIELLDGGAQVRLRARGRGGPRCLPGAGAGASTARARPTASSSPSAGTGRRSSCSMAARRSGCAPGRCWGWPTACCCRPATASGRIRARRTSPRSAA